MSDPTRKLANEIEGLSKVLAETYPDRDWSARVGRCAAWIRSGDGFGVTRFLELMRPLGDIAIHDPQIDDHYQASLARAYKLAMELRWEAEPPRR